MIRNLFFIVVLIILIGCDSNENKSLRIAQQYSMIYAPIYVADELKIFNEFDSNLKVQKHSFGGGTAIIEALIGKDLDMGCVGIPPAIIAINKGADLKIGFGINIAPIELMVLDKDIKSLDNIQPNHKIAVPGAISIQQMMLSMAAIQKYNDATKFDKNIITMKNPDSYTALMSGTDIAAHFAPMPFNIKEKAGGARVILNGDDLDLRSSIVCLVTKELYNDTKRYQVIKNSFKKSIELLNSKDKSAMEIISKIEKLSLAEVIEHMDYPGNEYTMEIYGVKKLESYMLQNGYIKNKLQFKDYFWEEEFIALDEKTIN